MEVVGAEKESEGDEIGQGGRRGDRGERPREDRAQGARLPARCVCRRRWQGTRGEMGCVGAGLGLEAAGPWAGLDGLAWSGLG